MTGVTCHIEWRSETHGIARCYASGSYEASSPYIAVATLERNGKRVEVHGALARDRHGFAAGIATVRELKRQGYEIVRRGADRPRRG